MTDERTEGAEQEQTEATEGTGPVAAPNDPSQSGDAAELTDEQKAQAEADATQGDQGPQVREQNATPVSGAAGFDPNAPVASSPPPPDAQSGVPAIPENEGVEAPAQPDGPAVTDPASPAEGGAAPGHDAAE